MNYSAIRHILRTAALLCAVILFFGACTEVDDRLGAGLIPKNQRMEIEVTSPGGGVKTYLYRKDSIPSSRTGRTYIGRTIDKEGVFGAQNSSALLQFLPSSLPYSNAEGYGLNPIIDSAVIVFSLNDTRGDTTVMQRFDVWEVAGSEPALSRDSTYYTNFPIEKYRGRRLFEFTHSGRRNISTKLFPTAAGKEYLNSIVNLPWEEYIDDSLFLKKFQGLYIAPAESSNPAAALYGTNLSASGIRLYVRNHDTIDVSAIYDTLVTAFSFRDQDDTSNQIPWDNVSINVSTFDYSGSVLGGLELATNGFTDTLPTSATQPTLYIQAMGGVGAYLRFTDELIEEIRNLKFKIDDVSGEVVGKGIAINQAMMRISLHDGSTETLDKSMTRIGSYLNPTKLSPIPDYQYAYEASENQQRQLQAQQYGSTYTPYMLPYNGYLNRSNAYYEIDITSYIQQLAREKEDDPEYRYISPVVFIGPEAYGIVSPGESVLKGFDSDTPIAIRITYTIIEG